MEDLIEKTRLIYKQFVILALVFVPAYTFLDWLLFIKLHLFSVDQDIFYFFIPYLLSFIIVLIWLRPRVKLLNLKRKNNNRLPGLYYMVASFAIAVPTIVAQNYIDTATGKLTMLENINFINKVEPTKYYKLKTFFIDKKHIGISKYRYVNTSGHGQRNSVFTVYITMPIYEKVSDTINKPCQAWVGVRYNKPYDYELKEGALKSEWDSFIWDCNRDFRDRNVEEYVYLNRVTESMQKKGFTEAIVNSKLLGANTDANVFTQINEPFEERNGNKLMWIFLSFAIGAAVWLLMILIPSFDKDQLEKFKEGKNDTIKDIYLPLRFLIPNEKLFFTPLIIDINIIVFIVMVFSGLGFISFEPSDLIKWGGNFAPLTMNGQWWRLLTCTFLHGGIIHLVFNMYALLFVGLFLESVLGSLKFGIIYLITGIIASSVSMSWHGNVVAVGASGAIFGMYGVFLAFLLSGMFPKDFGKAFLASTFIFIGYNLLMGLSGNTDNAAHVGGLCSGFIIGMILYQFMKDNKEKHWEMFHETKKRIEESKTVPFDSATGDE